MHTKFDVTKLNGLGDVIKNCKTVFLAIWPKIQQVKIQEYAWRHTPT